MRRLHGRRARGDIGGGLACAAMRCRILLADAIAADEDLVALCLCAHRCEVGLRFLERAESAVQRGAVGSRVDLVEPLPALTSPPSLNSRLSTMRRARTHLRNEVRGGTAGSSVTTGTLVL